MKGKAVILDATFTRRAQRERIVHLADKLKVPLLVIHCSVSDLATQTRLSRRAAKGTDVSDGHWQVYAAQKAAIEPIEEIETSCRLEVKTDSRPDQIVSACETFLRSYLAKR